MEIVHYNNKNNNLREILNSLQIGNSITLTKSSFDDNRVNDFEFEFNLRASNLNCDVECDVNYEDYRMKLTFIERQDKSRNYGSVIRTKLIKKEAPIKQLSINYKKGDKVSTTKGNGFIVKFPSNKEIHIGETPTSLINTFIVLKEEIEGYCI